MVLLLTSDLFFSSRIQSAAASIGRSVKSCLSEDSLAAEAAEFPGAGVLVDLELPGLDIVRLMENLPDRLERRVFAYGPHVHAELLEQARQAGCEEVHTRGSLDRQLLEILQRLDA